MHLPEDFRQRITRVFRDRGVDWLDQLPALIDASVARWRLTLGPPFEASYSYAAPCTRDDGSPAVLRIAVPDDDWRAAVAALRHFDGHGSVQLIDADDATGAMLLERLLPGTPLVESNDDDATFIAAGVMRALWRAAPPTHAFPTVEGWARALPDVRARFDGGTGPFPAWVFEHAEARFAELLPSQGERVVLHGDLHHWNIASAQREPWLSLDPHGVVGEREFEVGAWMRNPNTLMLSWPDLPRIQHRRLDQLAEALGFDRARLSAWSAAQAVMSVAWTVLDGPAAGAQSRWDQGIAIAESLAEVDGATRPSTM